MAGNFYRYARRSSLPAITNAAATATATALVIAFSNDAKDGSYDDARRLRVLPGWLFSSSAVHPRLRVRATLCEAPRPYRPSDPAEPVVIPAASADAEGRVKGRAEGGMWGDEERDGSFHGLFPRRQLWRPALEYPLWDHNWDGRQPPPPTPRDDVEEDSRQTAEAQQRDRLIRKEGVTRHIILIRHGQYDETSQDDSRRLLTPLGRKQAELTGQRLGRLVRGVNEQFGPCRVRVIRVSNLARAKETADIIHESMDLGNNYDGGIVSRAEPDPLLNEGRPCHHIPGGIARPSVVERTDEQHPRIEEAFRKYFYRAEVPDTSSKGEDNDDGADSPEGGLQAHPKHEFEVIVCHANVIRYFFCRALQLPPEAWLRLCTFNCSLTYFTIRPTGTVSCRMLGDIGHLPHELCTFSMHSGFNW